MQRVVLSTDDVPEAERFSYWREEVCEGLKGFSAERNRDRETPFEGRIVAWIGPSLTIMRYRGTGMRVFRRPRDIARHPMNDYYWLHYEWSLGERVVVEGRELMFRPGDLVLKDTTAPLAVEAKADYDHQMWLLPRSLLDPHLPISQRPRALTPIGSSGVAGMVKAYLDALGRRSTRSTVARRPSSPTISAGCSR
jgi:hypothetical protein